MALFSRTKDPGELTEQERHEAMLRETVDQLRAQVDAFKGRVKEQSKAVKKADKEVERLVADAKKKLAAAQQRPLLAYAGQIKVFEDRVQTPEGMHPLDENATFAVDSAGNMAVTRRHTLTRAAVLGPLSLFTPKATKHDDRELYFIAEHPEWASISKLNPDAGAGARQAAAAANLAARQSGANRQARDKVIRDANENLRRAEETGAGKRREAAGPAERRLPLLRRSRGGRGQRAHAARGQREPGRQTGQAGAQNA
jgi:hypothetical protein